MIELGRKLIVSTNLFMDTIIQPVTTKAKRGPYRQHSDEFKRAAMARTRVNGASVSLIACELKINTNQLFSWRKRPACWRTCWWPSSPTTCRCIASL